MPLTARNEEYAYFSDVNKKKIKLEEDPSRLQMARGG